VNAGRAVLTKNKKATSFAEKEQKKLNEELGVGRAV
jgi:hypothetical protein